MGSIVFGHFAAPLRHFGAWLETDREILAWGLAQAGRSGASRALDALGQRHLDADATPVALRNQIEPASAPLAALLEIPTLPSAAPALFAATAKSIGRKVREAGFRRFVRE